MTERPHRFFGLLDSISTPVVHPCDAFYTQKNQKRHIIPGFTVSRTLAEKSLDYMLTLAAGPNCVALLANHNPEVKEQIITL